MRIWYWGSRSVILIHCDKSRVAKISIWSTLVENRIWTYQRNECQFHNWHVILDHTILSWIHDEDWKERGGCKTSNNGRPKVTHWWDASQIYGSSQDEVYAVRIEGAPLHLEQNSEIDYKNNSLPITGFSDSWWAGECFSSSVCCVMHHAFSTLSSSISYASL